MGCEGEGVHQSGSGWSPVFVEDNFSVMSAGFLLPSPGLAVLSFHYSPLFFPFELIDLISFIISFITIIVFAIKE